MEPNHQLVATLMTGLLAHKTGLVWIVSVSQEHWDMQIEARLPSSFTVLSNSLDVSRIADNNLLEVLEFEAQVIANHYHRMKLGEPS